MSNSHLHQNQYSIIKHTENLKKFSLKIQIGNAIKVILTHQLSSLVNFFTKSLLMNIMLIKIDITRTVADA